MGCIVYLTKHPLPTDFAADGRKARGQRLPSAASEPLPRECETRSECANIRGGRDAPSHLPTSDGDTPTTLGLTCCGRLIDRGRAPGGARRSLYCCCKARNIRPPHTLISQHTPDPPHSKSNRPRGGNRRPALNPKGEPSSSRRPTHFARRLPACCLLLRAPPGP